MSANSSLIRIMVAGAVLSFAAVGVQAQPTDPVSVSDNASEQGKANSADGIQRANEARGTVSEETTSTEEVSSTEETSSTEDTTTTTTTEETTLL